MNCSYYESYLKGIENPLPELARTFQAEKKYLTKLIKQLPEHSKIIELGCGIGRPIIELATQIKNKEFYGIDYDTRMISGAQEKLTNHKNMHFLVENAFETSFQDNYFVTSYSTYNLVGSIPKNNLSNFFKEQKRITKKEIISIFWNDNDSTTEFLKKYYASIDIKVKFNSKGELETNKGTRRPKVDEIISYYDSLDITILSIDSVGKLWTAVRGEKNV